VDVPIRHAVPCDARIGSAVSLAGFQTFGCGRISEFANKDRNCLTVDDVQATLERIDQVH
jgi:hypothetical protein